eukprot:PhM_4_TR3251/c0_g1_i1/m.74595
MLFFQYVVVCLSCFPFCLRLFLTFIAAVQVFHEDTEHLTRGLAVTTVRRCLHRMNCLHKLVAHFSVQLVLIQRAEDVAGVAGTLAARHAQLARLELCELALLLVHVLFIETLLLEDDKRAAGGDGAVAAVERNALVEVLRVQQVLEDAADLNGGDFVDRDASVLLQNLAHSGAHWHLDERWLRNLAGDRNQLDAALLLRASVRGERVTAVVDDRGNPCQRFDVVHQSRDAEDAVLRREDGALGAGLRCVALDTFEESRLLTTDVGAAAENNFENEVLRHLGVERQVFLEACLEHGLEILVLETEVHHCTLCPHRVGCETHPDDHTHAAAGVVEEEEVLECVGQSLIGVDDNVLGLVHWLTAHRGPLDVSGETSTTAATQCRALEPADDLLGRETPGVVRDGAHTLCKNCLVGVAESNGLEHGNRVGHGLG